MGNLESLRRFIIKAGIENGYGSGDEDKWIKESDGSTTIEYPPHGENSPEGWRLRDNFFGGEPYGGHTIIHYQDKPFWMMVYYGAVDPEVDDVKGIYTFLQKALLKSPEDIPLRGPMEFSEGKLVYLNSWKGDLANYSGEEKILEDDSQIYWAKYMGGLVDQRPE